MVGRPKRIGLRTTYITVLGAKNIPTNTHNDFEDSRYNDLHLCNEKAKCVVFYLNNSKHSFFKMPLVTLMFLNDLAITSSQDRLICD